MSLFRIYETEEIEYKKLQLFCEMCNKELMKNNAHKYVFTEDIWFDLGQDWRYTALVTEDFRTTQSWQSVCPRDYEAIVSSDSFSEIEAWAYAYADALIHDNIKVNLSF